MYGTLEYDGDGNLVARLSLYRDETVVGPELARVTTAEQVGLLNEYHHDAAYEELTDWQQADVVRRIATVLTEAITTNTRMKPFVNDSNGHADLDTAVRRAVEPGGPVGDRITFRLGLGY